MTIVDFSYWAIFLFIIGNACKYVFSKSMSMIQYCFENSKNNKNGYNEIKEFFPNIENIMPFDKYLKAQDYSNSCFRFSFIHTTISKLIFILGTVFCIYPFIINNLLCIDVFYNNPLLVILGATLIVEGLKTLISIPFSLYDVFVLEAKYGFNTQTIKGWFNDLWKNVIIENIQTVAIISGIYYCLYVFTTYIYSDLSSMLFICSAVGLGIIVSLFYEVIYINIIAPIFNKFTPMEDNELKKKIISLISSTGYSVKDIFIIDAGKRSKHSNAYFTGWGSEKRIVLYDTLLTNHTDGEILAILGHEAGHLVHKDIFKGRIISAIYSAIIIFISVKLITNIDLYHAFGYHFVNETNIQNWYIIGFSLAEVLIETVSWIINPLFMWLSRRDEYAADKWSAEHVSAKDMINSLVQIYSSNLSGFHVCPEFEFLYYGHPGIKNRITALQKINNK